MIFIDGVSVERIEGFEGLNDDLATEKGDEWPTGNLAKRLALTKAINYTAQDLLEKERSKALARYATGGLQEDLSDYDDE